MIVPGAAVVARADHGVVVDQIGVPGGEAVLRRQVFERRRQAVGAMLLGRTTRLP